MGTSMKLNRKLVAAFSWVSDISLNLEMSLLLLFFVVVVTAPLGVRFGEMFHRFRFERQEIHHTKEIMMN